MERTIQTGIASFGMSGQVFHGPSLKVCPGYKVCSVLERTKNNSAKLFPEATIVRSYEEMLSNPDIELIVVNTPDRFHFEMSKAALLAGKHVVIEKPFAQTVAQAEELIELAKKQNKMLTVYQNRRWDGDFLTVKKIIEDGLIGEVAEFESHFDRFRNTVQQGTWKEDAEEGGSVLYNLGSHMIDQALFLFGKPQTVTAHLRTLRPEGKITDYYDIRLDYGKFAAIIKCSYLVREPGPRYMIHGTKGSFLKWGIDPQEEALKAGILPGTTNWGQEPEADWGLLHTEIDGKEIRSKYETIPGNYLVFYQNVYDAIIYGSTLAVKPEESKLGLEILEACLRSNEEKRTIIL